ncbi:MAG: VTT domain-containing protein [Nitrospiraceae bacterium]
MNDVTTFLIEHGASVLFAIVLAEQVGLPIPAIPLLVAAGALAGGGALNPWAAVGIAVIAALLGDWLWYELGRRRGRSVLTLLCRIALEPDSCVRRTEQFFLRHGARSLIVAKFFPGLSTIAPPLAGVFGMRVPVFFLYDGFGALIWAGSMVGLGYLLTDQLETAFAYAAHMTPAFVSVAVVSLAAYIFYKGRQRRQLRRIPRITAGQLRGKLESGESPVIVDLRSPMDVEREQGIPGALAITSEDLLKRYDELPRDRDLVLYCACPNDASSVYTARLLHEKGLTRVWPLAGGIEAWRALDAKISLDETRVTAMNL